MFLKNNLLLKMLKNSGFVFSARASEALAGFIISILIARNYGAEGFGRYQFVVALIYSLYPLVDFGLDYLVMRDVGKNHQLAYNYLSNVVGLRLSISFAILVILGGFTFRADPLGAYIILFALTILVFRYSFYSPSRIAFFAFEKLAYDFIVTLIMQIIKIATILIVIKKGSSLLLVFSTLLIVDIGQSFLAVLFSRRLVKIGVLWQWLQIKYFFSQTAFIIIALGLQTAYFYVDVFVLKALSSEAQIGIFSAAYKPLTAFFMLCVPAIQVILPSLSLLISKSKEQYLEFCKFCSKALLVVTTPLMLIGFIYGQPLMELIFGEQFIDSGIAFRLLCLSIPFHLLAYFFQLNLISLGHQNYIILPALLSLSVNFILDLIFIPKWGVLGACFGTIAADISSLCIGFVLIRILTKFFPLSAEFFKGFFILIISIFFLYIFRNKTIWFVIPCFLFLYFILNWVLGLLNRKNRLFISEISYLMQSKS